MRNHHLKEQKKNTPRNNGKMKKTHGLVTAYKFLFHWNVPNY